MALFPKVKPFKPASPENNVFGTYTPPSTPEVNVTVPEVSVETIENPNPFKIPTVPKSAAHDNLGVQVDTVMNTPVPTSYSTENTPGSNRKAIMNELYKLIGESGTQGDYAEGLRGEYDLAGKQEAVNQLTGRMVSLDRAYEKRARAARENKEGKFGGAVESDISNINRLRNEELADLAIRKSVALGDLQTAQSIVDAQIAAKFEPINNRIKSLESFYNMNLNDMTDSEKYAMERRIAAEKASLKGEMSKPTSAQITLAQTQLQNSKGEDGYVDPTVYKNLYDSWVAAGYNANDFADQFPPDAWVNPANTWLPKYLLPKKSGGGRSL